MSSQRRHVVAVRTVLHGRPWGRRLLRLDSCRERRAERGVRSL